MKIAVNGKNFQKTATCCLIFFMLATSGSSQNPKARTFTSIEVRGNERFADQDILATSGLRPGDTLGEEDLIGAVQKLEYTGEFEDVVITSQGETLIITVDEAPQFSGGLSFGLGYDTDTGAFGVVGLSIDDAFGATGQVRGNLYFSDEVKTLQLQVRSESFWAQKYQGGVRVSYGNYQFDNTTYQFETAKIEPYVVFDLNGNGAMELRYTLGQSDISNVAASASPIVQAETGSEISSGLGFSFATGSKFFESENLRTDAWSLRFDQDFTGLGGDTELSISRLTLAGRKQLSNSGFAIRSRFELGAVVGRGSNTPRASDRFTLGGSQLRGFERGTISPRDITAAGGSTILGGNYFAVSRTDLLVPILKDRPELETFLYFDVGSVWNVDTATAPAGMLDDDQDWRSSFGIGASFDTSIGKFEAYLALDTDGKQFDKEQEFGLTFRSQF